MEEYEWSWRGERSAAAMRMRLTEREDESLDVEEESIEVTLTVRTPVGVRRVKVTSAWTWERAGTIYSYYVSAEHEAVVDEHKTYYYRYRKTADGERGEEIPQPYDIEQGLKKLFPD